MKKDDLFDILGDINQQYVEEAHRGRMSKHKAVWRSWAITAACLALLLIAGIPVTKYLFPSTASPSPTPEPVQTEGMSKPIPELQSAHAESSDKEEASVGEQNSTLLVVNEVNSIIISDIDVEYSFPDKLPEAVWTSILDEFQDTIGNSYDEFTMRFPDTWEVVNFYCLSTRGYKADGVGDEYRLHDYVFECQTGQGGEATIALCTFEAPLRDYFIECENSKQSNINGVPLTIYGYESSYMVQFSYENVNYDIETNNIALEELEALLTSILTPSDSETGSRKGNVSDTTIEDAPADAHGSYHEAIDSNTLPKNISEFFGGSYTDSNGSFVIVLTEDTAENRTAICKELGVSESTTAFVSGTYTLAYLTELQAKISNTMINKEFPFVVSSSVREATNNIVVGVTTQDNTELAKLYALDTLGGAILVEYTTGAAAKDMLPAPKEN